MRAHILPNLWPLNERITSQPLVTLVAVVIAAYGMRFAYIQLGRLRRLHSAAGFTLWAAQSAGIAGGYVVGVIGFIQQDMGWMLIACVAWAIEYQVPRRAWQAVRGRDALAPNVIDRRKRYAIAGLTCAIVLGPPGWILAIPLGHAAIRGNPPPRRGIYAVALIALAIGYVGSIATLVFLLGR